MSSRSSTTAADALHQAALNVKNASNPSSNTRYGEMESTSSINPANSNTSNINHPVQSLSSKPINSPNPFQTSVKDDHFSSHSNVAHDNAPGLQDSDVIRQPNIIPDPQDMHQSGSSRQHPLSNQTISTSGTKSGNKTSGIGSESVRESGGGTGFGIGRMMHTVESVTRDAQAQIDAQVSEALLKSRALSAQDAASLQTSVGSAKASLEEQARLLKEQIDGEKQRAEEHIKQTQQQKMTATAERQALEEKAILQAAAARKLELEQKSLQLQREIDEITRLKVAEMMAEKPGNLQFVHQHQDTSLKAHLAGDIGHALDLRHSGRVTETTTGGDVQYHPVQVQTIPSNQLQRAQAQEQTQAGPDFYQRHDGVLHAMRTEKTPSTTSVHSHSQPQTAPPTSQQATGLKHGPDATTRTYDSQSSWANEADKYAAAK